jgi:alpha-1,3-glucosyltransferase
MLSPTQVAYPSILVLHLVEALFTPPTRYPDLFPVLNVLLCAPIFGLAWCWSIVRGVETLWALGALGSGVHTPSSSSTRGTAPSKGKERANGEAKSPEVRTMSLNPASPISPVSPVVEL